MITGDYHVVNHQKMNTKSQTTEESELFVLMICDIVRERERETETEKEREREKGVAGGRADTDGLVQNSPCILNVHSGKRIYIYNFGEGA